MGKIFRDCEQSQRRRKRQIFSAGVRCRGVDQVGVYIWGEDMLPLDLSAPWNIITSNYKFSR